MSQGNITLAGRRALVTGGGRGIGAAVAMKLAAAGARVAVHFGSDGDRAQATLQQLPGGPHALVQADLADPLQALALPGQAARELGGLDLVVNNAGIYEPCPVEEAAPADWLANWERTLAVNLTGPMQIIKGALPLLAEADQRHIVNISSRGAYRGEPEAPAYGASKAALNSITQSLARRLGPQGIHLTAVAPGWVATDMTREHLAGAGGDEIRGQSPLDRTATPEEVAEVVLLVVSGRADALTGAVLDVNCASYFR